MPELKEDLSTNSAPAARAAPAGDANGVVPSSDARPFRSSAPLSDASDSSALRPDPQQPPSEVVRGTAVGLEHGGEASRANPIESESSISIGTSSGASASLGTGVDEAARHPVSSDVAAGSGGESEAVASGVAYPVAVSTEGSINATGIASQSDTMQQRQHDKASGQSAANRGSAGASMGSMEGVSTAVEENRSRFDSQKVGGGSSTSNLLTVQGGAHLTSVASGATMASAVPGASPSLAVVNATEGASRASDIAGGGLALQQQSAPQQQPLASKTATDVRDHRMEEDHKISEGVGASNGVSDDFSGGTARGTSPITVVGSSQMEARVVANDVMAAAASGVSVASVPERSAEEGGVYESNGRNIAPRVLSDRSEVSRQGGGDKAPHLAILSRGNGASRNRPASAPGQGMGYGMPGGFGPFKFNIPTTAPAAATLNP